jgi:hypothetical protein
MQTLSSLIFYIFSAIISIVAISSLELLYTAFLSYAVSLRRLTIYALIIEVLLKRIKAKQLGSRYLLRYI